MKKMMKKLIAMAAALVMIVTLLPAVGVKADTFTTADVVGDEARKGSITIHKTDQNGDALKDAEFTIYKLIGFDVNDGQIVTKDSQIIDKVANGISIDKIDTSLFTNVGNADAIVNGKYTPTGEPQKTDGTGDTRFSNLDLGIYLVKETDTPNPTISPSLPFFISVPSTASDEILGEGDVAGQDWVYDITARPKNSVISGGKEIVVDDGNTDDNNDITYVDGEGNASVGVGAKVKYRITATSPKFADEDPKAAFVITDKINNLNILQDTLTVRVTDADSQPVEDTDYTVDFAPTGFTGFTITFLDEFLDEDEWKNKEVVVEYTAEVAETAVIGTDKNKNTATVDFGNGSSDLTGTPSVYVHGVTLTKLAADTNQVMPGVVFELYEEDGITPITDPIYGAVADGDNRGKFVTGVDGKINIKNLVDGTYVLKEVKTENDYTLLANPITITIDTDAAGYSVANPKVTVSGAVKGNTDLVKDESTHYYTFTVENQPGFSLPETGGMGTYLFTIGGIVIMAGAAIALIAMKKRA